MTKCVEGKVKKTNGFCIKGKVRDEGELSKTCNRIWSLLHKKSKEERRGRGKSNVII